MAPDRLATIQKSNSVTNTELTSAAYTAAKSVFLAATKQDLTVIKNNLKKTVSGTKLGNILPLNSGGTSQTGCEHTARTQTQEAAAVRPKTI